MLNLQFNICRFHKRLDESHLAAAGIPGQIKALKVQAAPSSALMGSQAAIVRGIRNKLTDARTHTARLAKDDVAPRQNGRTTAQQELQNLYQRRKKLTLFWPFYVSRQKRYAFRLRRGLRLYPEALS